MINFILFLSFPLLSTFFFYMAAKEHDVIKKKVYLVISLLLITLPYYIFQIGADHKSYEDIIHTISINGPLTKIVNKEIFFKLVTFILTFIFNTRFIFFIFGFIINFNIFFGISKLKFKKKYNILFFFYMLFYPWTFVAINQMIGISFIFVGICYFLSESNKQAYCWIIIGSLWHYSLFLILFIVLLVKYLSIKKIIILFIVGNLLLLIFINLLNSTDILNYLKISFLYKLYNNISLLNLQNSGISLYLIYFIPTLYLVKRSNNIKDKLYFSGIILSLLFLFLSKGSMIMWRIALIPLTFMPICLTDLKSTIIKIFEKKITTLNVTHLINLAFLLYGIIYFYACSTGLNLKVLPLIF